MNLMNLFNFSYLKQNLKKSKVTLAFVLLILPILNLIIFLMNSQGSYVQVFDIINISGLTIFGMFILPIVLSVILFGFVFKKKAVDFMGSMPIDRKTIFLTNTLGGILIILILLFVTAILMLISSILLSNIYLPLGVVIDYFILFTLSYIFVFTASNIAISLCGNVATSLIVTALILFFIPYHHFMYTEIIDYNNRYSYMMHYKCEDCTQDEYKEWMCEGTDEKCILEYKNSPNYYVHLTEKFESPSYTLPADIIATGMRGENILRYDVIAIGKMALLSVLYILIGCLSFERKEMEVCETSFKKFSTHQLVKTLTLIPIFVFLCLVLEDIDILAWIFVLSLVLVYNFVYDLITRHSIINIKKNLITFMSIFIAVAIICIPLNSNEHSTEEKLFKSSDVDKLSVSAESFKETDTDTYLVIKDQNIIKTLLKGLVRNTYDYDESFYSITIKLDINNHTYIGNSYLEKEEYYKLEKLLEKDTAYQKISIKEKLSIAEVITIDNNYMALDGEGLELLKNKYQENYVPQNDFSIPLDIYTYEDHKLKKYRIYSNLDKEFNKYILEKYNDFFAPSEVSRIYSISLFNINTGKSLYVNDSDDYSLFVDYLTEDSSLDLAQEIYKVNIYTDGRISNYRYYTNLNAKIRDYFNINKIEEVDGYYYVD